MFSSSLRLGPLFLSICTTSDAFTAIHPQRLVTAPSVSALVSPLRVSKTTETIPDLSSSTKPVDESSVFANGVEEEEDASWQKNLDMLLAPDTSVAERQIVLSDLLSSGDEIQESVQTALRERKVRILIVC